ncbi:MAG TPA: chemotaxis protein CheA [Deltaproteobacteria bacterium]|nr:chemotaxis protein CheA [Deltaproteobacteria bacterium]
MDENRQAYREEVHELLGDLEDALIELEQTPDERDLIDRVFRAMHTIKGSGAMFGFEDIAAFTHTIETVYDLIREGILGVTPELISLTLASCDQIKAMVEEPQGGESADTSKAQEITDAFKAMIPAEDENPAMVPAPADDLKKEIQDNTAQITYRIRFRPHTDIFANGTNPIPLLNELKYLGDAHVICHLNNLPELTDMDPEACYANWDIILTTNHDVNAIRDVFIFVEDLSDIDITKIDEGSEIDQDDYKRIGEILFERGDIKLNDLELMLNRQKRFGEILIESGKVNRSVVQSALAEQEHVRNLRKKRMVQDTTTNIRVPSHKLDAMVNLVGEMVTMQARLTQIAHQKNDPDLILVSEEVERLTAELRDNAMGIRMLPIGTTFAKFKRMVRDLSTELGKEVDFITQGEETELDKTVIEKLGDPLVHIIRNSIDHGIELPQKRKAAGKPPQGTIELRAEHSGANVLISVHDDGAGLDTDAIFKKAVEKGLASPDASLTDKEIHEFILAPGFSTAKNVSSVSGRGVGMDVVTSSIESFGGSVEIRSVRGNGTTITLKLPLTLAIIDGLLVTLGDDLYVIPLGSVVECVELTKKERKRAHGRHVTKVRDDLVPYIYLREVFSLGSPKPAIEQIVITQINERRIGFVVDKVIGEYQTVIKNLGKLFKNIDGVSGATIMGDGTVALILDITRLIVHAEDEDCRIA